MKNRVLGWILLLACILMLIGGGTLTTWSIRRRTVQLRGYVDPTQNADLPFRVPLAGVNVELTQYNDTDLDANLKQIADAGYTWVRQEFRWPDIEPTQGQFDFSHYDRIVKAVKAHPTLQLVAVLGAAPQWARNPNSADRLWSPPASMATFGTFAGQVASHYAGDITYYQIWDEPNLNTNWGGLDVHPADYTAMLRAAYTAIHADTKNVTVIAAALAPTTESGPHNLSDVQFLDAMYADGAKEVLDAAAGKPYGFDSAPDDRTVSPDVLNFSHLILLREVMVNHGDGHKALWGSNFGWNHLPDGWSGPPSIWGQVNAQTQINDTQAAWDRAAKEWPWIGGLILEHWDPAAPKDDPIQGFAAKNLKLNVPQSTAILTAGLYDPTDPRVTYIGQWRLEPGHGADVPTTSDNLPADGSANKLTFQFVGTALAFNLRRDNYVAYMYVNVDNAPANALPHMAAASSGTPDGTSNTASNSNGTDAYIMLKSPDLQPQTDLILAARGLADGTHKVDLRQYLGYGQWALAGIAVGGPVDYSRLNLPIYGGIALILIGLIGFVVVSIRTQWWSPITARENLKSMSQYFRQIADILFGLLISIAVMLGMFLTWRGTLPEIFQNDEPAFGLAILTVGLIYLSPSFLVTTVALLVLWILIFNRPLVGLALILFWAPFFGMPVELYLHAASMVEVCLVLTLSAVLVRWLVGLGQKQREKPDEMAIPTLPLLRLADMAILALVLVAGISLLWSEQREPALRELRIIVIEPALFYFLIRTLRLSRRDLARLVETLIFSGTVVSLIGIMQLFINGAGLVTTDGTTRIASVYGSPNNLALFLGRCIPFALAMVLISSSQRRRIVIGIQAIIMIIAVLLTQSGGALLFGLPAAVIVILILWNRRGGLIAAGAAVVGVIALIPLSKIIPRLQNLFSPDRVTSLARINVWHSAINLLGERPITGAGLDQFLYLYRSRYILPEGWREPDLSHPHNIVLDYWVRLGIAGLAVLVMLQVAFWSDALAAWRRWRGTDILMTALAIGAMGSMADFLVHGLVDNSYFVVDLAYIFCFTLALVGKSRNLPDSNVPIVDKVD